MKGYLKKHLQSIYIRVAQGGFIIILIQTPFFTKSEPLFTIILSGTQTVFLIDWLALYDKANEKYIGNTWCSKLLSSSLLVCLFIY